MTDNQKIIAARKKLNDTFPRQIGFFYYKGLRISKSMFFNKGIK